MVRVSSIGAAAFAFALALEYAILPNLRLRADGSFTWLSRISVTGVAPPAADSDVNAVSSRPQQGLLLFSAIYVF